MMRHKDSRVTVGLALIALCMSSCSSSARQGVDLELRAQGEAPTSLSLEGGGTIEASEAKLAWGPVYLCTSTQAGELCESAQLEWLESAVVDVLSTAEQQVGLLDGFTGTVRSWMYDLAFTSTLSADKPLELEAASELGSNSFRLRGVVQFSGDELPFESSFPIQVTEQTEPGFSIVRSSTALELAISEETQAATFHFDVTPWLEVLRLDDFVQDQDCSAEQPTTCRGFVQQSCDADGDLQEEVDCRLSDQVCAPFVGCADQIELDAESRGGRALRQAIVAGARPEITLQ